MDIILEGSCRNRDSWHCLIEIIWGIPTTSDLTGQAETMETIIWQITWSYTTEDFIDDNQHLKLYVEAYWQLLACGAVLSSGMMRHVQHCLHCYSCSLHYYYKPAVVFEWSSRTEPHTTYCYSPPMRWLRQEQLSGKLPNPGMATIRTPNEDIQIPSWP